MRESAVLIELVVYITPPPKKKMYLLNVCFD